MSDQPTEAEIEKYKTNLWIIGKAFNELPNHQARLDTLAVLTSLMVKDSGVGIVTEWLEQAEDCLKACMRIWQDKKD